MDKILKFLGICMRAGKIVYGEQGVESSIKAGKSKLVIIASDSSENTIKKFKNSCKFYSVDYLIDFDKESIAASIGKYNIAVISITDINLANKIKNYKHI